MAHPGYKDVIDIHWGQMGMRRSATTFVNDKRG
jgi:hypothetical protein